MKILLITSIYPIPDISIVGSTSVCHYFAKEWIKEGHDVHVVNTYTTYTPFLHFLSKYYANQIANIFPVSINTIRYKKSLEYQIDGVPVLLIPTNKHLPKLAFPKKEIKKTAETICQYLDNTGFKPDIITTHFLHPNEELIPLLKQKYPSTPMGISLHGKISSNEIKIINQNNEIDFWGFRSIPIQRSFDMAIDKSYQSLYCFSGIPDSFIEPNTIKKHNKDGVENFIFVGNLIQRKHPMAVVSACSMLTKPYNLTIVGSGAKSKEIKKFAAEKNIQNNLNLTGKIPRQQVIDRMREAECFVMISEDETFGLVYLEAMAKGCIVIASRNEGMDGIIINGVNGFLCQAGNSAELSEIIRHVQNMTRKQKTTMAQNAISTANQMTDKKMALSYLNSLNQILCQYKLS